MGTVCSSSDLLGECLPGGGGCLADTSPCGQNDRQVWKHYLGEYVFDSLVCISVPWRTVSSLPSPRMSSTHGIVCLTALFVFQCHEGQSVLTHHQGWVPHILLYVWQPCLCFSAMKDSRFSPITKDEFHTYYCMFDSPVCVSVPWRTVSSLPSPRMSSTHGIVCLTALFVFQCHEGQSVLTHHQGWVPHILLYVWQPCLCFSAMKDSRFSPITKDEFHTYYCMFDSPVCVSVPWRTVGSRPSPRMSSSAFTSPSPSSHDSKKLRITSTGRYVTYSDVTSWT